jgi:hypothetical protein
MLDEQAKIVFVALAPLVAHAKAELELRAYAAHQAPGDGAARV